jgi:hypothetical protein
VRTLPLRLAPIDGESLPGYLARYAHTFQFPPGDVVRALGLDQGAGTIAAAGRYGVSLTDEQLLRASFATGIATEMLQRMLLSRYADRVFPRSALAAPVALASAAQGHEVLIWSSRFCPSCLESDGGWRVAWQLGWSFLCSRHQVLLARRCPTCDAVPRIGPQGRFKQDRHGILTNPGRCTHRHRHELCRTKLADTETEDVADNTAALAAQVRIDELLDGQRAPALAGFELPTFVFLRDLLTLCNLLNRHIHARPPGERPLGRRLHDHPDELAEVLPHALALADLPNPEALQETLRELADQRYQVDGLTLLASKSGPRSEQLATILQHAVSQAVWASASRQLGLHPSAHRRPEDLDQRIRLRHVPQLFWADDYHREIAELFDFDDFTHWLGRRFCSVLLCRMLTPLDWEGAVRYLDFPEHKRFINEGYNTTFTKLRGNDRFDELARRVKRIANERAGRGLVNYKQRRVELSDWHGIDLNSWHLLQPRERPLSPWRRVDMPTRRAHASIWLWSELTSGDERVAPIKLPTRRGLFDQTNFIRTVLPAYRERLLTLGDLLLATPADTRSTLHNRLAAALRQRGHLAENFYLDTIDPLITARVLAHVSAHTGVDIPSIASPSVGSHAPPAVTHARLLATSLLRHTALGSYTAIGAAIGGDGNHLADNDRRYRHRLEHDPHLAAEVDELARAVDRWRVPAPAPPTKPHNHRMRDIAIAIKLDCEELLSSSHGAQVARFTSISLCRNHTDLTCYEIADIHAVNEAQPAYSHDAVARHRRTDHDYAHRYRQLADQAGELQRHAGYARANLKRGLTTQQPA